MAEAEPVRGDVAGGLAPAPLDRWASAVEEGETAQHGQDHEGTMDERWQRWNPVWAALLQKHLAPQARYLVTTRQAAQSP